MGDGGVTDTSETAAHVARQWTGRIVGIVAAGVVYVVLDAETLGTSARTTASVGALMAVWWMTEAVPLAVTSLLPVALFPVLGIADVADATRPYASDIIFLFGGGFVLAAAVQRWDLHRRIALSTVLMVGTAPRRLVGGFMLAAAFLSMWVSNSATTVMMLPIGTSVVAMVHRQLDAEQADAAQRARWRDFGTALLLAIAYAASIGSVATIIGTPPNGILVGFLAEQGQAVGFAQWMRFGVPVAVVFLVIAWWLLTRVVFRLPSRGFAGGETAIRAELARLGRWSAGERATATVFVATAGAWIGRPLLAELPGLAGLTDASIAIGAAVVLFLIPVDVRRGRMVLDAGALNRIPWNVLLLFGGGLSLARAVGETGLAAFFGAQLVRLGDLPGIVVVLAVAAVVILLTEITSNTATTAVLLPVLAGVAVAIGTEVIDLVLPAAVVATFAFMLPVATPPNAIAYASGHITVAQMARAGALLNVVGVVVATLAAVLVAPHVFG